MKLRHRILQFGDQGNALLTVLLCMMGITILTTGLFYHLSSVNSSLQSTDAKQQTFYLSDGLRSVLVSATQAYLAVTPKPLASELTTILTNQLKLVVPPDYEVSDLNVSLVATDMAVPIPSGSFSGMNSPQTRVEFQFTITRFPGSDASIVNYIDAEVALAQIAMFQFTYFVDLSYADFYFGPTALVGGRVHSNGDLCIGGNVNVTFQTITSANRIMIANDNRCRLPTGNWDYTKFYIAKGPNFASPTLMDDQGDNDCTNCDGTGQSWKLFALNRWAGNVQDKAHGIQPLKLPIPNGASVQSGVDGPDVIDQSGGRSDYYVPHTNAGNIRFTVDPELPTDGPEIRKQKFSSQADIRVIDGVWYLNSGLWPGVPIWSDHPGSYTDPTFGIAVGQADIATRWGWATPPPGFSYYGYDAATHSINGTPGVISYGSMAKDTTTGLMTPAYWIDGGVKNLCPPDGAYSATGFLPALTTNLKCTTSGAIIPKATQLLLATRTGFFDGHISLQIYATDGIPKQTPWNMTNLMNNSYSNWYARIVPVNFDLDRFQAALIDKTPGALGSYFGAGSFMGHPFNGILFITATWPGSQKGYLDGTAPDYYFPQGSDIRTDWANNYDANQVGTTMSSNQTQHTALPFPLCASVVAPGPKLDGSTYFKIPNCAAYGGYPGAYPTSVKSTPDVTNITSYPNAIRFVNGNTLKPINFPTGLSLVSNIGVYIAGDMNTISDPTDLASQIGSSKWMPLLVAGDQVTFLSNSWDDKYGKWEWVTGNIARPAKTTTYNMALITGWARSVTSQALNSLPSLMEDWTTAPGNMNFNGSIMVGFYPVYIRHGRFYSEYNANATYTAGLRNITFDEHFNNMVNQPPGTPTYNISSVINWKTE